MYIIKKQKLLTDWLTITNLTIALINLSKGLEPFKGQGSL